MSSFDFGTRATGVDVRFDDEVAPNDNGSFRRDLQVVIDWINNNSVLISATRANTAASEGAELPSYTGGLANAVADVPVYLVGGTRGSSTNSDWQTGLDTLLNVRANSTVPLISQDLVNEGNGSTATFDTVAAQLLSHVGQARGAAQSERGGYLGRNGDLDTLIDLARTMNDTDIQVSGQKITTLDSAGNQSELDEWSTAVSLAGMRAGAAEVGEPMTFKRVKATSLDRDWET